MNSKDTLATDLLRALKAQSRRWFVAFLIVLSLLITSNLFWLCNGAHLVNLIATGVEMMNPCQSIDKTISTKSPSTKVGEPGENGITRRKRKYDYFRFHEAGTGLF